MLDGGVIGHSAPLAGLRVLDVGDATSDGVSRLYADLGADVLKVEPPGGSPDRQRAALAFALDNANKRGTVLDPAVAADRQRLLDLVSAADIVVDGGHPGRLAAFGLSAAGLCRRFSALVMLSVTDFGADGPRAGWQATDAQLYALSSALSRTGPVPGAPVLPPIGLASAAAAAQAGWAALAAYFHRLRTGVGDYIDFSRFEAVTQALDPPFGAMGQAASGLPQAADGWRGRPRNQDIYPIFACADGFVRLCVLSARQWRAMRAWLGEPPEFADPGFETLGVRFASRELSAAIAELFAPRTVAELLAEGQTRAVPIEGVYRPAQALGFEHFRAVGALARIEVAPDTAVTAPSGPFIVDGRRYGYTTPAPAVGSAEPRWCPPISGPAPAAEAAGRPFDGLRIIDLGIIVAGGELGRQFADLGAEVIKIESAAYPDGLRQAPAGQLMSRSFAMTHRNEYSFGLDLRKPAGVDIFLRLVAESDAVLANFKPGTLAALGLPYERLAACNPRVVLAESSAFGNTGPWSSRMGYGPLVRAATGITWLWTPEPGRFYDTTTIFPDHVAARITALAATAALIRARRSGSGAHVHISQAEVAINQLAARYAAESGALDPDLGQTHLVLQCAGEDEWCAVSLRGAADHAALAEVTAGADLPSWAAGREKADVADRLQRAGVPAAPMNRPADVLTDPQVVHRKLFTDLVHPLFDEPMPSETGPAPYLRIPPAQLRPAPLPGEHTRAICDRLLQLSQAETDRLIAEGVLFTGARD